jgi:hypothetical protein
MNLREGLPPLPRYMTRLPLDARGYPVPWFVQWFDEKGVGTEPGVGKPDFRIVDARRFRPAVRQDLCWLCGNRMGVYRAYVIGPMCAVNRISGEPPSHRECAEFAAIACPFLSKPKAARRDAGLEALRDGGGSGVEYSPSGIARNPGVALVWITRDPIRIVRYEPVPLFNVGEPVETLWFAEGRRATRAEIMESITSGLPLLRGEAVLEGPKALAEFDVQVDRAMQLLPG